MVPVALLIISVVGIALLTIGLCNRSRVSAANNRNETSDDKGSSNMSNTCTGCGKDLDSPPCPDCPKGTPVTVRATFLFQIPVPPSGARVTSLFAQKLLEGHIHDGKIYQGQTLLSQGDGRIFFDKDLVFKLELCGKIT